jgi:hypothetical protein
MFLGLRAGCSERRLAGAAAPGGWLWPACETLHFAGLALLIGVAGCSTALLGFMRSVPGSVVREFMPWAIAGFVCNADPSSPHRSVSYFANYTWWLKVGCCSWRV